MALLLMLLAMVGGVKAAVVRPEAGKATLLWADGIPNGGTTTLLEVRVTAVYGSNVTGTALQDFHVTGGSVSDFTVVNGFMASALFTLSGLVVDVECRMFAFSGAVFPRLEEEVFITMR